ncbi:MAG: PorT family protein [Flammeovirgaceae bacterium]|nr:PorT family protein [Flammeovirgaceae bacterium]
MKEISGKKSNQNSRSCIFSITISTFHTLFFRTIIQSFSNRFFTFFIITFLSYFSSYSQSDFRNGFILLQKRDTIYGLMNYRENKSIYSFCEFKKIGSEKLNDYKPNDIVGFGFLNDKYFESQQITLPDYRTEQVFVEVIIRGKISLYKYKDFFFIATETSDLQLLENSTKEVYVGETKMAKKTNQYISILNIYLTDCESVKNKIPLTLYNEKSLTNLIYDYNLCSGKEFKVFKEKKAWSDIRFGLLSGVNRSKITFEELREFEYLTGSTETAYLYFYGLSFSFSSPRISEKFAFQLDMVYQPTSYYKFSLFESNAGVTRNYVSINLDQLRFPLSLKYVITDRKLTPYFFTGVSFIYNLRTQSNWLQEVEIGNIASYTEQEALVLKRNQYGVLSGMGANTTIKKKFNLAIEMSYELNTGISQESVFKQKDLNSRVSNWQFSLRITTK